MKLPAFDHNIKRWDFYNHFHVKHSYKFTQFETGEFMLTSNTFDPDERRMYSAFDVTITSTADADCPPLYMPGRKAPVPKAWLNRSGQQFVLIDHGRGKAVPLSRGARREDTDVPSYLRSGYVIWMREGAEPIYGGAIKLERPNEVLKAGVPPKVLSEVRVAITAILRMRGDLPRGVPGSAGFRVDDRWIGMSADEILATITPDPIGIYENIHVNGFDYPFETVSVPCLYTEEGLDFYKVPRE